MIQHGGIKARIEKLEKTTGRDMPSQSVTWFYVHGEPEPTEDQKVVAMAKYKESGTYTVYWKEGVPVIERTDETASSIRDITICVSSFETIPLVIRLMRGEPEPVRIGQ